MKKFMTSIAACLLMATMLAFSPGCQTATPSKAQSAEINADVINVTSGGAAYCNLLNGYTNLPPDQFVLVVESLTCLAGATECNVISQAMTNETGGDESNSQTASGPETPIDISVPTGTDAITALTGAAAAGVTKGLIDDGDGNAGDSDSASADCADGNCNSPDE